MRVARGRLGGPKEKTSELIAGLGPTSVASVSEIKLPNNGLKRLKRLFEPVQELIGKVIRQVRKGNLLAELRGINAKLLMQMSSQGLRGGVVEPIRRDGE